MKLYNKESALLLGIMLLALALRLITYGYEYLMGVDPFHHYKIAEYIAANDRFPERWHLSRYPEGEKIVQPMGLYYVSVLLYKLLSPIGFSFIQAFKLVPPLFGIITLIPVYFLTKELFDRKTAVYSMLILAFLPAFTYRTMSGFYRGDAFFMFFMVTGLYFYLKSLNDVKLAVIAGLSFGLMGLVWNGFIFGFVVLSITLILYSISAYVKGESSINALLGYMVSVALGIGLIRYLALVQGPHSTWFLEDLTKYIIPATIAFTFLIIILGHKAHQLTPRIKLLTIIGISTAAAAAAFYFYPEVVKKMLFGYGLVKGGDPFLRTIGELHPLPSHTSGYTFLSQCSCS